MKFYPSDIRSWGYRPPQKQLSSKLAWVPTALQIDSSEGTVLPFGSGRSYGDSCLNSKGSVVQTNALDRFIEFDNEAGIVTGEAGLRLADVLNLVVPEGWVFPVCPGTSSVTLAGAVANDVHGKNHHQDGSLGRHILRFGLLRSDGSRIECSRSENSQMFNATIGGLGLTGFITDISVQLLPIESSYMDVRYDLFTSLGEFATLSVRRKRNYQYTVAWLDCASSGDAFGQGVFMSANHSKTASSDKMQKQKPKKQWTVPFDLPSRCLNQYSIKAFNKFYFAYHKRLDSRTIKQHYKQYFFPLDGIHNWNRIYGGAGFHQYQFVIPLDRLDLMEEVLSIIVKSGMGSFLAVLKEFGSLQSPGLLSFPRQGWCLALDFSDRGTKTVSLIDSINDIVMRSGGAVYPAKDRVMSRETFVNSFPKIPEFLQHKDEKFSSDFWTRVHG